MAPLFEPLALNGVHVHRWLREWVSACGPMAGRRRRSGGTPQSKQWNAFIARYHHLGYKTLVGAQMRYTVHDRHGRLLALLGFSTAARKLAPRGYRCKDGDDYGRVAICQIVTPLTRSPGYAFRCLAAEWQGEPAAFLPRVILAVEFAL